MSKSENNKRIAKNTLMLYIRMLLSIVVSLYTSRVVLEVLGVEDYGIYGVVGGVVTMFSFLNASMAGATSRFLTFEMGRGDIQRLKDTFSSALIIHISIAFIVIILAETIGLWFLCNKLVIPESRIEAAHWVYQLSVWGMVVSITQVPYNATIIAHEKMDVYAYLELLNVLLKLVIVFLLTFSNVDKLILYASLVLIVNIIIVGIYRYYCVKCYEETRYSLTWDKAILKSMLGFSAWDVLGHFGYTFRTQGVNVVLNMFFGVTINAVTNIATTVQNTLLAFSNNVLVAIKPQIIKQYATGKIEEMLNLMISGIRFNLFLQLAITLPLIFCIDYILNLWLKNPPSDCAIFCQLMLWSNLISSVFQIVYSGIQATGRLRASSICRNVLYVGTPILIYVMYVFYDFPPATAYVVILSSQFVLAIADIVILKNMVNRFNVKELLSLLFKVSCIIMLISVLNNCISSINVSQIKGLCFVILNTLSILAIMFYFWIFNSTEKLFISTIFMKISKKLTRFLNVNS